MQKSTIAHLNKINQEFYNTVATDFDDSRNHSWPGWQKLLEHLDSTAITSVLDLGCGNGRFGTFAQEHFPNLKTYTGIDNNKQLLEAAKTANPSGAFIQSDIVANFLSDSELIPTDQHYDLVVIFGVMHHIPSLELRALLLEHAASLLTATGKLVFTTWQFMEFERFSKKTVDAEKVDILAEELEDNDFFLDWQRGPNAIRYCHYYTKEEVAKLLLSTHLKQAATFHADGKEGSVNAYYVVTPQK